MTALCWVVVALNSFISICPFGRSALQEVNSKCTGVLSTVVMPRTPSLNKLRGARTAIPTAATQTKWRGDPGVGLE